MRHLSQSEYAAWVLILQLSTYVNLLDFGLQSVLAQQVAEHHSRGDHESNRQLLSTAVAILLVGALAGSALVLVLVWRVPHLFLQMPPMLWPKARMGLLVVGLSSAFALPLNPFSAVFTGLQEYVFPTVVAFAGRILSTAALICVVLHGGGLLQLAVCLGAFNLLMAFANVQGWRQTLRKHVDFTFLHFHRASAILLARSGGALTIWLIGGLFVSGLDAVIVGHFDFSNTGFYAVASTATNLMLITVSSLFSPLIPAVSSMQSSSTPEQIGDLTVRVSRYCSLLLCAIALVLLVFAFPLLSLWVGRTYALRSSVLLQVLVLGNFVRQLGYAYSTVVIATGKQHLATAATVAEALVNLTLSVWFATRMGAVGVAFGTLAGAFVSVGVHLAYSMRRTRPVIAFSTGHFVREAILRPVSCALPSLLLLPFWRANRLLPASPAVLAAWAALTMAALWFVGLKGLERQTIALRLRLSPASQRAAGL